MGVRRQEIDLVPAEAGLSFGVLGAEKLNHLDCLIGSNGACEMHETQTFVHLIIPLLPPAHCKPRPLKSATIAILTKIRVTIRQTAGSRHGCEESSKRPS